MDTENPDTYTVADFTKDLAIDTAKTAVSTFFGIGAGVLLLGASVKIVEKVQRIKADRAHKNNPIKD